jgi:Family of unknown function (DUF6410)
MKKRTFFTLGRDAGLFGRWIRLIFGVAIPLYILIGDLWGKSLPPAFIPEIFLWFGVVLAIYLAAHYFLGERFFARVNPWIATLILVGPVIVAGIFPLGPAPFRVALALYIIISLIFNFAMSYGGCEVLAIPSLIFGRRYVVYCPWNAVDVVDKVIRERKSGADQMG